MGDRSGSAGAGADWYMQGRLGGGLPARAWQAG
jgi:hypothetical protein